ncbi:MAG TPA: alpha/beta hydrolase, partial [Lactobacillus acetotolerans]|nr:alpha/beta hydrolase [Lactobacillus acetotolerans]
MFSKIRKSKFLIFLMLLLILLVTACSKNTIKSNKQLSKTQVGYISTTPTFFFHGWGSSVNAESHMV